jgi:antitoxin Phd
MEKLTYRNSAGELVDLALVPATKAKNEFGSILEQATHGGAVAITRHQTPKAVLLPYAEFEALVRSRSRSLGDLESEFDQLLQRMQSRKSKQGMKAAFEASPTQLGRAALKQARKRR